jgi:hypothetical protein
MMCLSKEQYSAQCQKWLTGFFLMFVNTCILFNKSEPHAVNKPFILECQLMPWSSSLLEYRKKKLAAINFPTFFILNYRYLMNSQRKKPDVSTNQKTIWLPVFAVSFMTDSKKYMYYRLDQKKTLRTFH